MNHRITESQNVLVGRDLQHHQAQPGPNTSTIYIENKSNIPPPLAVHGYNSEPWLLLTSVEKAALNLSFSGVTTQKCFASDPDLQSSQEFTSQTWTRWLHVRTREGSFSGAEGRAGGKAQSRLQLSNQHHQWSLVQIFY